MPDHLHLIVMPGEHRSLSRVVASFSKHTSREINRHLGRSGRLWEKGFYERKIRNEAELLNQLRYIRENPVRKGYVEGAGACPYCDIYPEW